MKKGKASVAIPNTQKETPTKDGLKCPSCGSPIEKGIKFCGSCGNDIQAKIELKCPNCGASIGKDGSFCPECGQKI
ncbi:MAG: Double zinc ribbon [Candidatus Methanofastidiosum methylothiophilum]|uniref:Double zinc ribbon n=1 Tax=Candidatus Methanofastidiosum methylothiophilum TaxID=1705564 RepID=A0A150III9_9EURY|nr:MAG: Double zinc ribbon [Candidatus Methanofastidiosum methylthiophilus]